MYERHVRDQPDTIGALVGGNLEKMEALLAAEDPEAAPSKKRGAWWRRRQAT